MKEELGKVEKGWGYEHIWVSNERYCSKFLCFNEGGSCSMHFHVEKMETWYVQSGKFKVEWIDTRTSKTFTATLLKDSVWENLPLSPHRLTCLEEGTILEVSTSSTLDDNYRIAPGDSQRDKYHRR